jgi:voltage-gated potassium channel
MSEKDHEEQKGRMKTKNIPVREHMLNQRLQLLHRLESRLELPMLILSFIWLVLMILELTAGLSPFLIQINNLIWFFFVADFLIKVILAPSKVAYIKKNWVTTLALALPALRLFRIFRAIRLLKATSTIRTLRLARILTSLNRGITALGKSLGRRGFGYVLGLTLIVLLAGAAGVLSFEKENGSIQDYGTAVWWTAMILTTMGSDYFPKSSEGRILCLMLAVYGFAVFGYVTAAVATFFVGQDAENKISRENEKRSLEEFKQELSELKRLLQETKDAIERNR